MRDIAAKVWLKGSRSTPGKAKTVLYITSGTPRSLHNDDRILPLFIS